MQIRDVMACRFVALKRRIATLASSYTFEGALRLFHAAQTSGNADDLSGVDLITVWC